MTLEQVRASLLKSYPGIYRDDHMLLEVDASVVHRIYQETNDERVNETN